MEVAKSFEAGYKGYQAQWSKVFKTIPSPRYEEKFSVRGGYGDITPTTDGGAYNMMDPKVVGTQTIAPLIYKNAVQMTKMAKVKDNYMSLIEDTKRLGYLLGIERDTVAATVLNNAASTTVTWDGVALASASHLIGDTGDTQSNITTGGIGVSTLEEALQNFKLQKDQDGRIMNLTAKYIVYPVQKHFQIAKLIDSQMSPEDANNNVNPINSLGLIMVPWAQLNGTTFDAMLLSEETMHRLVHKEDYPLQATPARDTNTGNDMVQWDLACNYGAIDYLGTYFITA